MTLQEVMTQVRIDRTVIGIRRKSWPDSYRVLPGRGLEEDTFQRRMDAGGGFANSDSKKYTPNLSDICATDWDAIR